MLISPLKVLITIFTKSHDPPSIPHNYGVITYYFVGFGDARMLSQALQVLSLLVGRTPDAEVNLAAHGTMQLVLKAYGSWFRV